MKNFRPPSLSILCLIGLSLICQACQPANTDNASSTTSTTQSETTSEQISESSPPDKDQSSPGSSAPKNPPREITYVAEKIDPSPAILYSQSPKSQINVRSQPSTQSKAKHFGIKGDPVTLLKQATGEGEYRWYYLRFDQSKAEGWIREDFIDRSPKKILSRTSYRSYNFDTDPWLSSFNQTYNSAKQGNESWLFSPTSVASRLAGNGCKPDNVETLDETDAGRVTVIIKQGKSGGEQCADDSVSATEIRVDLVKSQKIWEIEWAGGRYRCQPGRGQQNFAPKLCI